MNILITGIHGFVGSNLLAALKEQHTIYGLDIVSPQKEGVASTFGWNELEQVPTVDAVIHLAGKAHDTKNQTNAQVYFDISNVISVHKDCVILFLNLLAYKQILLSLNHQNGSFGIFHVPLIKNIKKCKI